MKRLATILIALSLALSACGGERETVLQNDELLAVEDLVCSWDEAQIFILSQEAAYGKTYGDQIWDVTLSEGSFEAVVKKGVLNYLKLLFVAAYGAGQLEVTLSEAERAAIENAADSLMEDLGEETEACTGITRQAAVQAYTHYALAQIFYRQTVMDAHTEISDEEARVMSVEIVAVDPRQGYAQVRTIHEKLTGGASVSEALRGYEGVSSRHENISRGTYSGDFDGIVFSLKAGQWTPILQEGDQYYIVRCVETFLADETAQRKATMEIEAREKALDDALAACAESVQLVYNEKLWNSWDMSRYAEMPSVNFFAYSAPLEK